MIQLIPNWDKQNLRLILKILGCVPGKMYVKGCKIIPNIYIGKKNFYELSHYNETQMDKLIKMIMIIGMRFLSKYHLKQNLRSLYRDFVDTYKKTYIYFLKMPIVYTYKSGNKYMYNL